MYFRDISSDNSEFMGGAIYGKVDASNNGVIKIKDTTFQRFEIFFCLYIYKHLALISVVMVVQFICLELSLLLF
jgi:hypothetical protein